MRRPMTLGNGTVVLDADKITDFDVMGDMLTIEHEYQTHLHFPDKSEKEILQEFVFAWDKALNPPIKVTQAVLDAMDKVPEANYKVQNSGHYTECYYDTHWGQKLVDRKYIPRGAWVYEKVNYHETGVDIFDAELQIGDYIQADCPLALQVLLQFHTEGEKYA